MATEKLGEGSEYSHETCKPYARTMQRRLQS